MSDPFSESHRQAERERIKQQDKAHQEALREAAKKRIEAAQKARGLDPNRDVGFPWQRKFFELRM